jgi:hypothetical protein
MTTWSPVRGEDKEVLGYFKEESKPKEGVWSKVRRLAKEHNHTRKASLLQIALVLLR